MTVVDPSEVCGVPKEGRQDYEPSDHPGLTSFTSHSTLYRVARKLGVSVHFENDNFLGFYEHISEKTLVIGLGGTHAADVPHVYWGQRFFRETGVSYIALTPKARHWWFAGCFGESASAFRQISTRYDDVVIYGYSMGGHGAFIHGDDFGANRALSISPQYSIDPEVIGENDYNWSRHFRAERHKGMEDNVRFSGDVTMVLDPTFKVDAWHAKMIEAQNPKTTRFVAPFAGHNPLALLKGAGITTNVITDLLLKPDDLAATRRFMKDRCRNAEEYKSQMERMLRIRRRTRRLARLAATAAE